MATSESWLTIFAERLGLDGLSDEDVATILEIAASAAHASQRTAAPVACWLAAQAGLTPQEALTIANNVTLDEI